MGPRCEGVAYTRISTDKETLASQLSELREYCSCRGWTDVEEIADVVSGAKSSREELDRLTLAVRRVNVDVVVCCKLDRLGPEPCTPDPNHRRACGAQRRVGGAEPGYRHLSVEPRGALAAERSMRRRGV
jgi:Resolvase, N terminal domain